MTILDSITSALGGNILTGVSDIIKLFKVDPAVALANQTQLEEIKLKMISDSAAAVASQLHDQALIDQTEAASQKLFVSGWRPWIGWVCGVAFAYAFVLQPLLTFVLVAFNSSFDYKRLPSLDLSQMLPVLLGMLGLAAARTVEKVNGINSGS